MLMGELFEVKYKEINNVAKLITRRKDIRLAPDLINTTYLEISKFKTKPTCPNQFFKLFCHRMKFNIQSPVSKFNKQFRTKESELTFDMVGDISEVDKTEVDNYKAPTNLNYERAGQYSSLLVFKKSLPLHEQVIFDLLYFNDLSARDITKQLHIEGYQTSRNNVNKMVNSIKTKLEKWKTKQL